MTIDPEEFDAWREQSITKAVFAALAAMAEQRKQVWVSQSWDAGDCDEKKLLMLRGQAEAFAWLPRATHAEIFGELE